MKISVIGAGNVGSLTAMRLAQENFGEIVLVDVLKGLARGKALDMEDARPLLNSDYNLAGSDDINSIKDSAIVVVTAGFARKPGMTREELLNKNAAIIKEICQKVKMLAPDSILVVVTNPLDIMTYFALKITGFKKNKVLGMGISLDTARFTNLIGKELDLSVLESRDSSRAEKTQLHSSHGLKPGDFCEGLNVNSSDIEAYVIGTHGEGMLPLPGLTKVKGKSLDKIFDEKKVQELINKTVNRGIEIVSLLGSGSAYFAPSAAVAALVEAIAKDKKQTIGACAYLEGEYGLNDVCIGVPCLIGSNGIEKIIELGLNREEKEKLSATSVSLKELIKQLPY